MDCTYCGTDMENSDICSKCGMGKRIDYELFKTDKAERKKDFEGYEKKYLDRLEKKDNSDKITDSPEPDSAPTPDNSTNPTLPSSTSNTMMKIALGLGIPLLFGIITGAIMAMGGGGETTNVYYPQTPQYANLAP